MSKKLLLVDDINIAMASIAIDIQTPPNTLTLVLSELIRLSEDGYIVYPSKLSPIICEKLNLSPENYRASMIKLAKLKLITRHESMIFLSPIIKTPFEAITIKQK